MLFYLRRGFTLDGLKRRVRVMMGRCQGILWYDLPFLIGGNIRIGRERIVKSVKTLFT